jgi:acyl carrier protein
MRPAPDEIEAYVLKLLQELARDWDYSTTVGADTRLFSDLGFESLDAVVLGTAIQEHYDRPMPFAELLAEVGQRDLRDLTVGELVGFVETHLASAEVQEA